MAGYSTTMWGAQPRTDASQPIGWNGTGYNPNSTYGGAPGQATAEVIAGPNGYLENEPRAIWDRWIGQNGLNAGNANSDYNQWLAAQYSVAQRGYKAALPDNPNLTFQQFVAQPGSNYSAQSLQNQYLMQTPQARGEQWGLYAPRVRYLGR